MKSTLSYRIAACAVVVMFDVVSLAATAPDLSALKNDDVLDLSTLSSEQERLYDAGVDVRREIDRSRLQPGDPLYALNAIGKVTPGTVPESAPNFIETVKAQERKGWGTGFMVSPCHMITNHHVVANSIPGDRTAVLGRVVNFSFGESVLGNDFMGRESGRVVCDSDEHDVVIVKLRALTGGNGFPYLIPKFMDSGEMSTRKSFVGGYPEYSQREKNHKMFGMKAMLHRKSSGVIRGKVILTPGSSGSPAVYIEDDVVIAYGLAKKGSLSTKRTDLIEQVDIVDMTLVAKVLFAENPELFREIQKALVEERCK